MTTSKPTEEMLDAAALEAAHATYERFGQDGDLRTRRLSDACLSATIRTYLATLKSSPVEAVAVKIRPLEWSDPGLGILYADTIVGAYKINKDGYWWLADSEMRKAADVEAAKAAAQADYATRIRSALALAPLSNPEAPERDQKTGRTAQASPPEGVPCGGVSRQDQVTANPEAPAAPVEMLEAFLGQPVRKGIDDLYFQNGIRQSDIEARLEAALVATPPAAPLAVDGEAIAEALLNRSGVSHPRHAEKGLIVRGIRDALAATAPTSAAITAFATAILHGDDEHRGWLKEAAEAFNAGKPMPAPRGKGTQPAPTSAVDGEVLEALRKARPYVEMIVTDGFYDTGTDKADLAAIDAALNAQAVPAAMGGAGEMERLREALEWMLERERRRYDSTVAAEGFYRSANAMPIAALAGTPSLRSGGERST